MQAIGDGVGGGLAALGEGGADQREEGGFVAVRHGYGGLLPHIQADDGACHLGGGVKAAGLDAEQQLRLGVIGHGVADCTRIPRAGGSAEALCGLLLHHYGNVPDRQLFLQQAHQNRAGDVVRQVGTDGDGLAAELLGQQSLQIDLQHVVQDELEVVVVGHRLFQQWRQTLVDLDGDDIVRTLAKLLGQHADAGADLKCTPAGADTGGLRNAGADTGVDDEILAEALGQGKVIPCAEVTDGGQVSQCGHGGRPFRVNKNQFCPASAVAALTALLICGSVSSV